MDCLQLQTDKLSAAEMDTNSGSSSSKLVVSITPVLCTVSVDEGRLIAQRMFEKSMFKLKQGRFWFVPKDSQVFQLNAEAKTG